MSETDAIVTQNERDAVLAAMTPACRTVADEIVQRCVKLSTNMIETAYFTGQKVVQVLGDEIKYGTKAMKQLSEATDLTEVFLGNCKRLTEQFSEQVLKDYASRVMANGGTLHASHFFAVGKVENQAKRQKLLDRALTEGLSVRMLEDEINPSSKSQSRTKAGRRPDAPKSPEAGLKQMTRALQVIVNRKDMWQESVCDTLDKATKEAVSKDTLTLVEAACESLSELEDTVEILQRRLIATAFKLRKTLGIKPG